MASMLNTPTNCGKRFKYFTSVSYLSLFFPAVIPNRRRSPLRNLFVLFKPKKEGL
jgi:hypothetical protein